MSTNDMMASEINQRNVCHAQRELEQHVHLGAQRKKIPNCLESRQQSKHTSYCRSKRNLCPCVSRIWREWLMTSMQKISRGSTGLRSL